MSSVIKFVYFDMGNVLLYFDHHKAARQIAALHNSTEEQVWQALFQDDLYARFDRGDFTASEVLAEVSKRIGSTSQLADFEFALSNIFRPNLTILPVLAGVQNAGYGLGILSNTCTSHWNFVREHCQSLVQYFFTKNALSFEIRSIKPEPAIYKRAAEIAGVAPNEIFYCDDILRNVEGAQQAGFNAVVFESTAQIVREMQKLGMRFNY